MTRFILFFTSLAIVLAILGTLTFSGCDTFKPVIVDGQPDECNDFYTVMKYYSATTEKDSAFVGIVYTECKIARGEKRKQLKEKHCKEMIFGQDALDRNDFKRYSQYQECSR